MTRFLILQLGFNNAVRCVAGVVGFTALTSLLFCNPNPKHIFRKPEKWNRLQVWVDPQAFAHPSFNWFAAGVCFVFLGFYAVFFNLEEWAVHHGFGRKDVPGGPPISREGPPDNAIQTFWLLSIMNASSTIGRLLSALSAQ
jgi:MCP family monocarboxylic acid transporter-like MFS transporter 10